MPATNKPTPRFLSALRDVLFETTPDTPAKVSAPALTPPIDASPELEAARSALQQSIEQQLGPGVRELFLQTSALADVLPDARQRQRAALKVLSLKGIPASTLVVELERALSALSSQNQAFTGKLNARRSALDEEQRSAVQTCEQEGQAAEQAMQRLQSELEAERRKQLDAATKRDERLAACRLDADKLTAKQLGFERALAELAERYTTLKEQLSNQESR